MRTKIFALLLGLSMIFCSFFAADTYAAKDASVTLSSAEAAPGETVQLSLSIADNPGLCALRIFVTYDSNVLTLENAEFTSLFGGGGVEVNTAINPFILLWNLGTSDFKDNGKLAVLRFKVKDGAAGGSTAVTLSSEDGDAFNVNFVDVGLSLKSGSVTVTGNGSTQSTAAQSTALQSTAAATDNTGSADQNRATLVVFAGIVVAVFAVTAIVDMIRKKRSR